ncbi:MAG TPA: ATP-binding cassette domain-containing protein [Acetobacteraceae bacterium]|nr:ATP-binding cassette domain-containing protein [Acetobacteraceae bacterium]
MNRAVGAAVLEVVGVSKSYPGVRALDHVSFAARAGEVHGLVGENGAGKSTLMRILSGAEPPDEGRLLAFGKTLTLADPASAHGAGIHMVWQDTRLVPDLDVAQNIALGHEAGGRLLIDRRAIDQRARAALARLGLDLDPRALVRTLQPAERQMVEIARALDGDARVLMLDEPTTALSALETDRLLGILRELAVQGAAIVFVSHRLREVMSVTDRVTVMKDGEVVTAAPTVGLTEDEVVRLMVGRPIADIFPPHAAAAGAVRLELDGFAVPGRLGPISLNARAGLIVGIGGIAGNGQQALVHALFGLLPTKGKMRVDGERLALSSPHAAIAAGLVLVPGDRRGEALFPPHSVRENITLPHLAGLARGGLIFGATERRCAEAAIRRLAIRTPSAEQPVAFLSGGNQQKVVLARWQIGEPKVLVFEEPTQGVDVGTRAQIYRLIRSLADAGAAVILLTSDLIELLGLADEIVVLSRGQIVDRMVAAEASEERVIGAAVRASTGQSGVPSRERGVRPGGRYLGPAMLGGLLAMMVALATWRSPYFLTARNLADLATQLAPLAIASLGQMAVILLGGIDLAVGPTISLVTGIASWTIVGNGAGAIAAGIVLAMATGVAIGGVNAFLIVRLGLSDLIATLASYSFVFGLALIVRPSPGGEIGDRFLNLASASLGGVPVIALLTLGLYIAAESLLFRGRIGARLYATGSRAEAGFAAGLNIARIRITAYLFCGLMAAVAGLLVAAEIGSGDPQAGTPFTLTSITAVVVGGTSIFGGSGTALGTLLGALLVIVLQNVLSQLQVSAYTQYVWTGVITLIAVALYAWRGRRREETG